MKRSTVHILTTHTGSLPRPPELLASLQRGDRGEAEVEGLDEQIRAAVADVNITLDRYSHLLPGLGPGRARAA